MTPQRIIAIGDIHGCVNALETLLEAMAPGKNDLLIVLGDFVDQGHETWLVIDCLLALRERCSLVCLKGNHEEMLVAARSSTAALRYWEMCGGVQTLNSYRFGSKLDEIPDDHWGFVAGCRDSYETADHMFVHANFDPAAALADQDAHTLRWELLDPAATDCHQSGKTVVLGHTEQMKGEILDLGCVKCIDTACWRCGWLTALDVTTNQLWQASRFGLLREFNEPPVGPIGPRR